MTYTDHSEKQGVNSPDIRPAIVFDSAHLHYARPEPTDPNVLARLEMLDDLMFAAIEGDATALETVIETWHKSLEELGPEVLEESRTQYLRRAQSVWNELRNQPNHPPHKVFAAIEVISLLAAKAW